MSRKIFKRILIICITAFIMAILAAVGVAVCGAVISIIL